MGFPEVWGMCIFFRLGSFPTVASKNGGKEKKGNFLLIQFVVFCFLKVVFTFLAQKVPSRTLSGKESARLMALFAVCLFYVA